MNLFVYSVSKELSPLEKMIVCMQIDSISASLSVTTSDKETLSARWFVILSAASQFFGLFMIGITVHQLPKTKGPHNFQVFWGGNFESIDQAPRFFWIYFASRIINQLHSIFLGFKWMKLFDRAERALLIDQLEDEELDAEKFPMPRKEGLLKGLRRQRTVHLESPEDSNSDPVCDPLSEPHILREFYDSQPSTVFTLSLVQYAFAIPPLIAVERLLAQCSGEAGAVEWGQMGAIYTCLAASLHWTWVQVRHVRDWRRFTHVNIARERLHTFQLTDQLRLFQVQDISPFKDSIGPVPLELKQRRQAELEMSIRLNDITGVVRAVRQGASVNSLSDTGIPLLFRAIKEGKDEALSVLLQIPNLNIDMSDENGNTALCLAVEQGHTSMVEQLLKYGADVDARDRKFGSALFTAVYKGRADIVQVLLDNGANVGLDESLYKTSGDGNVTVIRMLLEKGADTNMACNLLHSSPLHAASARGHVAVVGLLLDKGADVNAEGTSRFNERNGSYGSALRGASAEGHADIVRMLLDKGADVNARHGRGPLGVNALECARRNNKQEMIQILLENGARIDNSDHTA